VQLKVNEMKGCGYLGGDTMLCYHVPWHLVWTRVRQTWTVWTLASNYWWKVNEWGRANRSSHILQHTVWIPGCAPLSSVAFYREVAKGKATFLMMELRNWLTGMKDKWPTTTRYRPT
jgi:hypothetical protein